MNELIPTFFNKRICELTGEDNFHSRKQQVLLAVPGLNLEGYLFSTLVVPRVIEFIITLGVQYVSCSVIIQNG